MMEFLKYIFSGRQNDTCKSGEDANMAFAFGQVREADHRLRNEATKNHAVARRRGATAETMMELLEQLEGRKSNGKDHP